MWLQCGPSIGTYTAKNNAFLGMKLVLMQFSGIHNIQKIHTKKKRCEL